MQNNPPPPPDLSSYPQQTYGPGSYPPVPNYLVHSILATVFCCQLAIVGIIFAAQVDGKLAAGDYAGAVAASNQAKMWTMISVGLSLALWIVMLLFYALALIVYGFEA